MTVQHGGPGVQRPQFMQTANPTARPTIRNVLLLGIAIIGLTIIALLLAAYFGASFGVVTTLIGLVCALIPVFVVVPTFLWLDRFESEPTHYLLTAFFWGALASAFAALVLNTGAMIVLYGATGDEGAAMFGGAVVVAPLVEEALKGAVVLFIWWFRKREFDGLTDGLVYAGLSAAGFAFTENIVYLARAFNEGGGDMLVATLIARCLLSPFAHPMFTILIGVGIGIASVSRSTLVKIAAPVVGYVLACIAHALWNLTATVAGHNGNLLVYYVFVGAPAFIAFLGFVIWARFHEGRLIGQFLRPYADAGWLSPPEVTMLASMSRRRASRGWARANGGPAALRSMRAFQDTASELAHLRRRMYHSAADERAISDERMLLDNLVARRREFAGMPGQ